MSEIKFSGIVEYDFSDLEGDVFVEAGERVEGYLNYHGETPYILGKIEDADVEYVAPEFWVPVFPESLEVELFGTKIPFDRLRELADAEREGRLVVLPCKVGDIVFALSHCGDVRYFCDNDYETGTGATTCPFEKQCGIEECDNDDLHVFAVEVAGFYFGEKNPTDGAVIVNELDIDLSLSDFGKRAFVIEAEAERALAAEPKGEARE